jgi:hypothetical protein
MPLDEERLSANLHAANDENLLDRATIYRAAMDPEALALIDEELRRRGVTAEEVAAHAERRRQSVIYDEAGLPVTCAKCPRPAVVRRRGWHRLWGLVPVFPRTVALCEAHRPAE